MMITISMTSTAEARNVVTKTEGLLTAAGHDGIRAKRCRPAVHGGNVHSRAVRPGCHPDKLEKALVSGPYPVANTTSTQ
jgi:hypothetical protein